MEERQRFDNFKSNVCHMVKNMGDLEFINGLIKTDEIRKYYLKKWFPECFYLLGMLDYLSRENNLEINNDYNDIRKYKLDKPIYPSGILIMCALMDNNSFKEKSLKEAIPEFKRFNIVEAEIRNVC